MQFAICFELCWYYKWYIGIHFEMDWLFWTQILFFHSMIKHGFYTRSCTQNNANTHIYKLVRLKFISYSSISFISRHTPSHNKLSHTCSYRHSKCCVSFDQRCEIILQCLNIFTAIFWMYFHSSNITLNTHYHHAIFWIKFLFELKMESLSDWEWAMFPTMYKTLGKKAKKRNKQKIVELSS